MRTQEDEEKARDYRRIAAWNAAQQAMCDFDRMRQMQNSSGLLGSVVLQAMPPPLTQPAKREAVDVGQDSGQELRAARDRIAAPCWQDGILVVMLFAAVAVLLW